MTNLSYEHYIFYSHLINLNFLGNLILPITSIMEANFLLYIKGGYIENVNRGAKKFCVHTTHIGNL